MTTLPLGRLLTQATRHLVDEMHHRLAEQGFDDLRPAHGYVLNAAAAGGVTASALAVVLGVTKQGAAKVVVELEARGYVERTTTDDRRARPIALTPRGRAALAAAEAIQRAIEEEWGAMVGTRSMATLRRSLEQVVERVDAPLRPAW